MRYDDFFGLAMALFEESCDAMFLLDSNVNRVLDANAAAQRLSGLSLREMLVSNVSNLFQYEGKPGICPIPISYRRKHGPVEIGQSHLRTIQPGIWLPVQLTMTRLLVKPRPLTLLLVRVSRSHRPADSNAGLEICDKCGSPVGYAASDLPHEPDLSESTALEACFIDQPILSNKLAFRLGELESR